MAPVNGATARLPPNISVALGTALSRLTGVGRVVAIGAVLGGGSLADAYTTANNAPNAVYELLLGGVLSATLVPLFTDLKERSDDEGRNAVITVGLVVAVAVTVVAVLAAPLIIRALAISPGSNVDADEFRRVATVLARMLLVQIAFYAAVAMTSSVLNAHRRFFAAAWSPVAANISVIAAMLSLRFGNGSWQLDDVLTDRRLTLTLGGGATIGVALVAVMQFASMRRAGLRLSWNFDPRHPAVRRLVGLSGWSLGYVVANQIALATVVNLTEPGSGGRLAYAQAFTFFVLPHGLLAVSVATTMAPGLASAVANGRLDLFDRAMISGIRLTAFLTIPSSVGIFVLRRPIVGVFLQHGALDSESADLAARTLGGFSLGLASFSIYLFALRGINAHLDTRTTFLVNLVECAINVLLAFALVGRFGVPGLAASFAGAYTLSVFIALAALKRRSPGLGSATVAMNVLRYVVAALVMASAVWVGTRSIGGDAGVAGLLRLVVGVLIGVGTYGIVLLVLDREGTRSTWADLLRREPSSMPDER